MTKIAAAIAERIERVIDRLRAARKAHRGLSVGPKYVQCWSLRFPYEIFYRLRGDAVEICTFVTRRGGRGMSVPTNGMIA